MRFPRARVVVQYPGALALATAEDGHALASREVKASWHFNPVRPRLAVDAILRQNGYIVLAAVLHLTAIPAHAHGAVFDALYGCRPLTAAVVAGEDWQTRGERPWVDSAGPGATWL